MNYPPYYADLEDEKLQKQIEEMKQDLKKLIKAVYLRVDDTDQKDIADLLKKYSKI